jgi:thiol-disulfide isomerase/thioredoxin
MKYAIFLKICIFTFLALVVVGWITPSIASNSLLGFVFYFIFTLYLLRTYANVIPLPQLLLYLIASRIVIDFYGIYLYLSQGVTGMPNLVIHLSGITSGFLFLYLRNGINWLPILFSLGFAVFMFFAGWGYWIHKCRYGTFTGRIFAHSLPTKFEALTEEWRLITEQDFKDKIVILDFWTTGCRYCFFKFPVLDSAYETYKGDPSIVFYAVNKPIEEDGPNQPFEMIRERGFTFPVVVTKDPDMAEKYGVMRFPETFVINRSGEEVYRGEVDGAITLTEELRASE